MWLSLDDWARLAQTAHQHNGSCVQLPGASFVRYDYSSAIPNFSVIAAVLAGFTVALVGLLAQPLLSSTKQSQPNVTTSLSALIPGVAILILAAYAFAESAGSTAHAQQAFLAEIGFEALAAGALITFLTFALLLRGPSPAKRPLYSSATWIFRSVVVLTSILIPVGTWTLTQSFSSKFQAIPSSLFWTQLIVIVAAIIVAYLLEIGLISVPRTRTPPGTWFVSYSVALFAFLGLSAIVLLLLFTGNLCSQITLGQNILVGFTWLRTALWVGLLIAVGLINTPAATAMDLLPTISDGVSPAPSSGKSD